MKRTKIFAGFAALAFLAGLGFVSCSDGDNDDSGSKTTNADIVDNESEIDPDDAAFNVLRSLCNLAQYDENAELDEDEIYTGVETLPDGWEGLSFTCDQGVLLDESKPTVRSIATSGTDEAREFFSSMIGKNVTADSYYWDCTKLGALTFTAVKNDEDLYATIDIEVSAIPNVTQLRFVPAEVIEAASSENSYKGKPYYSAGDVIQRNSDGTYWICVRPAGGPLYKDKSYWICLSSFDKSGNTIIKSEVKKGVKTYFYKNRNAEVREKEVVNDWTYAKNLMSLQTAKAAHHTFNCIVNPLAYNVVLQSESASDYIYNDTIGSSIYDGLLAKNIDLMHIHRAYMEGDDVQQQSEEYEEKRGNFCIAYGNPKKDSNRKVYGKNENSDVNYVQPFIHGSCGRAEGEKFVEEIKTLWTSGDGILPYVYSITDSYDDSFLEYINTLSEGTEAAYDFNKYLHKFDGTALGYVDHETTWLDTARYHVIISPELCINDNKGTLNESKKPSSAYTDIYRSEMTDWYWASFDASVRYVDDNKVEWNKEND